MPKLDDLSYDVRISRRARRCRIHVGVTGVLLVVPHRMPMARAEAFLRENTEWIRSRLNVAIRAPKLPPGTILFQGNPTAVTLTGRALTSWLRHQAKLAIPLEVAAQAERMKLKPKRVVLRDQRTRWGSCSSHGSLSFNWRLIMAPPAVLSYVVIHELAHMVEHNHGPGFWKLVESYCPDFRPQKAWLKKHAHVLHVLPV